jgi:starch synthase (maltosyl-transferring)
MAYLKSADDNHILSIVNLNSYQRKAGRVRVPVGQLGIGPEQSYTVHDLITDARYTWRGEWNYVELDPFVLPMHLFRIEV